MLLTPYPWSPAAIGHDDGLALIAGAERLKRAAASPAGLPPLLRGKQLALLSDDPDSPAAQAFVQAATALGGHVTLVRASGPGDRHVPDLAALLGQLYDAIECQGRPTCASWAATPACRCSTAWAAPGTRCTRWPSPCPARWRPTTATCCRHC
jgi:hypothetical protein